MPDFSSPWTLAISLIFLGAGFVKGVTGMGLPTVAMGLLGALMSPVIAASLLISPSFVTNGWQLLWGPSYWILARRLWLMMAGVMIGTIAGASMLTAGDVRWTTSALGAALSLYAGVALAAPPFHAPPRLERWLSPLIGVTTGLVTGGTGVFVIPAVPYLQSLNLSKDDLIQALGLSFTVSTIALAIGLGWRGAFQVENLAASSLAIAPALAGMWLGQMARRRISPAAFRRWFLIFLLLLGLELMLRPLLRGA